MDFLKIASRTKGGLTEVYPVFKMCRSSDLMIRGSDFYAIWDEENKLWSTDEHDAIRLIDDELEKHVESHREVFEGRVRILAMWDASSGSIDAWHKYCQRQCRDNYKPLDEKLIFSNTDVTKKDYSSRRLSYPLVEGSIDAFDELMSVLYSPSERHKIEWSIGSIVSGESKNLQKFLVLYGSAGTGKSTVLNIIEKLFDGYHCTFDAKALGSANATFALEPFRNNPLVAIQHDGDLSKIEDNARLNSLVSHEALTVNEKFKSLYATRFKAFLYLGTNRPVKITDSRSGLIRRLIDVSPSGNKVSPRRYRQLVEQINFELGAIAWHCKELYLDDPRYYDDYVPSAMLGASNDFYNFMLDSYHIFVREDSTTLKAAWELYRMYCDDAKVLYPFPRRTFKEELKDYFGEYEERYIEGDERYRSYYTKFKKHKFEGKASYVESKPNTWLTMNSTRSIFDDACSEYKAQLANDEGFPKSKWEKVKTQLCDIDTSKTHWVQVKHDHIVVDFDLKDRNGEKNLELNLAAASKFPKTYAELSKSKKGVHLHYMYDGDVETLSTIFEDGIEVKTLLGNQALRRKLTKCNDLAIATINNGLPLKGENKLIDKDIVVNEKALRTTIGRCLNKEYHGATTPSINFIHHILEEAYNAKVKYDVTDLKAPITAFASQSSNQAALCLKTVTKMRFKSDDVIEHTSADERLVFYDVEVFPNLLLVNWKFRGDPTIHRMINPSSEEIESLLSYRLIGFNNKRYDNHILYGRLIGYTNEQIFQLSQSIVNNVAGCMFGQAYNLSYTDVYDYLPIKQSLKKWQIELGIHHQELGLPWDQPVPEDKWDMVSTYCDNDVVSLEVLFEKRYGDFVARQIQAKLVGSNENDSTNSLSTKLIFGSNKHPQDAFNYRFMGDLTDGCIQAEGYDEWTTFNNKGQPVFKGYTFDKGKSYYRGYEVGEGGYVYSEPGMYGDIALVDVTSMHPNSAINEQLFGPYTFIFEELVQARVAIKNGDIDRAKQMFNGKLAEFLTDKDTMDALSYALKIVINSIYGLTAARFLNPFKDTRNVDNIVAKRGALFMINLQHAVQAKGYTVLHVKTDSIKIADADEDIINFVHAYGKLYGYGFEHEATYDKMCLVNKAVYIAKYASVDKCKSLYSYVPGDNIKAEKKNKLWTATGTEFAVPYVFKTLFSGEDICFEDLCEAKQVKTKMYLDMNEHLPNVEAAEEELSRRIFNAAVLEEVELLDVDTGRKPKKLNPEFANVEYDELIAMIAEGHDYKFIGRIGNFVPVRFGSGGGKLVRIQGDKYYSVTGTSNYRWLEAELVKALDKVEIIDMAYFEILARDAMGEINSHGDFEWFVGEKPYHKLNNGILPF